MGLEEEIARLEAAIARAARVPLTGRLMLDEDELYALLQEIRRALPPEVQEARFILREKERILAEARAEADAIVREARARIERMARDSAILTEAERKAKEIVREAEAKAEEIRLRGRQYLDGLLFKAESHLRAMADTLERNRAELRPRSNDAQKTG
jgi:vacuolar-type H+-ATPase subunit H